MIIDNRGGAARRHRHPVAARAAPDGYTLVMAPLAWIAFNPQSLRQSGLSDAFPGDLRRSG